MNVDRFVNYAHARLDFIKDQGIGAIWEMQAIEEFFDVPEWTTEELMAL